MRTTALILAVAAMAAAYAPASASAASGPFDHYPRTVRPLLAQEARANENCRGGSGDDPATDAACHRRDLLDKRLNGLGWCWGPDQEIEASKRWMHCGRNAHRGS